MEAQQPALEAQQPTLGDIKRDPSLAIPEDQVESFRYLANMTSRLDRRYDLLAFTCFTIDGKVPSDPSEVNKRLFELKESLPEPEAAITDRVSEMLENAAFRFKMLGTNIEDRIRELEANASEYRSKMEHHQTHATSIFRDLSETLDIIDALKARMKDGTEENTVLESLKKVLESGHWQLIRISGDFNTIYLATTQCVIQRQVNPAANLDIEVNFGVLVARINLADKRTRVFTGRGCVNANGYYHTHISRRGEICWGDAKGRAYDALNGLDLVTYTNLLYSLLNTYEPNNPYIRLSDVYDRSKYALKSARINNHDFSDDQFSVLPSNLVTEADMNKIPWDTSSEIHVGQLVRVKSRMDTEPGQMDKFFDKVGVIVNISENHYDYSQTNPEYTGYKYSVAPIFELDSNGVIAGFVNTNVIPCTRDEFTPEPYGTATCDSFEYLRKRFHLMGYPFFGDKGTYLGREFRVSRMLGLESRINLTTFHISDTITKNNTIRISYSDNRGSSPNIRVSGATFEDQELEAKLREYVPLEGGPKFVTDPEIQCPECGDEDIRDRLAPGDDYNNDPQELIDNEQERFECNHCGSDFDHLDYLAEDLV